MLKFRFKSLPIFFVSMIIFCCAFTWTGEAIAKDKYPVKPIQLIAPWKAGGGTDVIMRIIAHYASQVLSEPMIVVNVPGVGGTLGARQGKDARLDGYTIVTLHQSLICSKLSGICDFDQREFVPVAGMTITPAILTARGDAPWNNLKDMIADAKKRPGEIKFGATIGSSTHFFPLNIGHKAGIKFRIVGYEGTADRMKALLGGFIDVAETNVTAGKKYFEAKALKGIGIATAERHPWLPGLPTLKEQGVDLEYALYRGMYAPVGTPQPILDKLEDAFQKVAQNPEFVKKIGDLGSIVQFSGQKEFKDITAQDIQDYTMLAEMIGMKKK